MTNRTVFFISDQTGVTSETLGHSLLTQFGGQEFRQLTVPFVDSVDKAKQAVEEVNAVARDEDSRPLVFSTLVQDEVREVVRNDCDGLVIDFFDAFLGPLEQELGVKSSHTLGRAHGMADLKSYDQRIDATNFAMANDDGGMTQHYSKADVILVGVSRSGKTPTCLYLALNYGVYAANYPLSEEELETVAVPKGLQPYREKLYGLTIAPERLGEIRKERRAIGRYASPQQVSFEVRAAEALFKRHGIPYVDTTRFSIEEIASTILSVTGVERRVR
jgi:regulator of PEP synthase PpsR (kinase-PPPase family)